MAIKEQSQRQLRVGQEIKRIIAAEINQGRVRNLEGISTLVTVMEAQVSPDLKYADVYFITSNPETDKEVLEGCSWRLTTSAKSSEPKRRCALFRKSVSRSTTALPKPTKSKNCFTIRKLPGI